MTNISTFTGLQTALRGILAHQQAIDTSGHNIANANTEGYSRQSTTMQTTGALLTPVAGGYIGISRDLSAYGSRVVRLHAEV